ncbi:hypothetical protein LINGRAHAP2_LOCUS8612, partial [Linum grandiflorum]
MDSILGRCRKLFLSIVTFGCDHHRLQPPEIKPINLLSTLVG